MKLQIHDVVSITIGEIEEFSRENGKASHVDFKTRDVFITDKNGVVFTIELFLHEADLVLTA
jgi:hypothetical protein